MLQDFFIQFLKRMMSENPTFFKVIQVIALVVALITFIPDLLDQVGITVPHILDRAAGIAAIASIFIAQLPIKEGAQNK